uniref:Uncharacterized protein n=1 Tax=Panagrolaimus davidi TaxID=227884 RepID=A0A914Q6G2_9BILA
MPNSSPQITHVIFDFDGVVTDTETSYAEAVTQALEKYGKKFNNTLKHGMMGRKTDESIKHVLEETDLTDEVDLEKFKKLYHDNFMKLLPKAEPLPGAKDLIKYLADQKIHLAISTGSGSEEFDVKKKKFEDVLDKFETVVLAGDDDEVKDGKPEPDAYQIPMKRFKTKPESPDKVLVFEDSINGVQSALKAGCKVVFVPQEKFKPDNWEEMIAEIKPKCSEIIKSLEEFKPEVFGLPPMKH